MEVAKDMRLLYRTPPPLEDVQLIAWHHMINDPSLITYTVDWRGRIHPRWVNPELALKRSLIALGNNMNAMKEVMQDALFSSIKNLHLSFKSFKEAMQQVDLEASLTDPEVVD